MLRGDGGGLRGNGAGRPGQKGLHQLYSPLSCIALLRQYLVLPGPDGSRPVDRVRGLIGSLDSGVADPAATHRDSVLESVKRGR